LKLNLNEYADLALKSAEITQEDGKFCGVIPDLPGVWAQADSKSELLAELREVTKSWVIFRESRGLPIPALLVEVGLAAD
jgi:predicted RNase H-like HicB family nuclease